MTARARPSTLVGTERVGHVEVTAPPSDGTITTTEPDFVDQRRLSDTEEVLDSGISGIGTLDIQQTFASPVQPQLKLMNPGHPLRYIPIHVWPEQLKEVEPRTGRKYYPRRSRTLPRRNTSSPLVREYRCADERELPREDQDMSDTETIRSGDSESAGASPTLVPSRRRGWRFTLLGVMQNAVPKRCKEEKQSHFTLPRRSLSLSPLRFGHHPQGLKKRGSRDSTKW